MKVDRERESEIKNTEKRDEKRQIQRKRNYKWSRKEKLENCCTSKMGNLMIFPLFDDGKLQFRFTYTPLRSQSILLIIHTVWVSINVIKM